MQDQKFKELVEKYLQENAGKEDLMQLTEMLKDPVYANLFDALVLEQIASGSFKYELDEATRKRIDQRIYEKSLAVHPVTSGESVVRPMHRAHFLKRWRWVAAAVLVVGVVITVMVTTKRTSPSSTEELVAAPSDILPGANKAVLTVDGKEMDLATGKNGIKVGETIAYLDGEKLSDAGKMLKLATPNGGQYQLTLPDGTKVWLNAASSISFPSVFNDGNRKVNITGEVYLEVAKDKSRPFLVDVAGLSTVEVLGTSFNVNAYGDEGSVKTSLVEGSVRVGMQGSKAVVLKPGQQATIAVTGAGTHPGVTVNTNADMSQVIAWKNGLFSFYHTDLRSVMKQLERWYDITVRYEGKPSAITLEGEMFRNVKLSDVLEFLKESGLSFRMEGKTLIVL